MSTSVTSPITASTFNGQSQFAASLQQVITRTVGIASLPLDSDEASLNKLTTQQTDLEDLDTDFSNIESSVSSIQTALTSNSLSVSASDSSVSASLGSGAAAGSYSILVTDPGSYSTALSNAGSTPVTDPTSQGISSSTSYTLNVGGTLTTITATSDDLDDLASAINTQAAGQVQATIVNLGSTASPDYRLSLTASNLGTASIDLDDSSGASLIGESTAGAAATYQVAGQSTILSSDSRNITLAPGLTVQINGQNTSGQFTTVTVADDPGALASAFGAFAQNYNQAVTDLDQYHGQNGGSLEGDSIINTLTGVLQQISSYSNGGPANSLASFGITVDDTGQMSIDTGTFTSAANANFSSLTSVLGGTSTGGFLQATTNLLNSVEDPTAGSVKIEENTLTTEIVAANTTITNEQAQITQIQTNITAQMVTADAAIAALESQVSYVNGLFYSITGNNNNPNASST